MKIRQGFVSNSSSSSFIVIFPRVPMNAEDVKEMLFENETTFHGPYGGSWTADEVAETIWNDVRPQSPAKLQELIEELSSDATSAGGGAQNLRFKGPKYPYFGWRTEEEYKKLCDEYHEAITKHGEAQARSISVFIF